MSRATAAQPVVRAPALGVRVRWGGIWPCRQSGWTLRVDRTRARMWREWTRSAAAPIRGCTRTDSPLRCSIRSCSHESSFCTLHYIQLLRINSLAFIASIFQLILNYLNSIRKYSVDMRHTQYGSSPWKRSTRSILDPLIVFRIALYFRWLYLSEYCVLPVGELIAQNIF